MLAILDELNKVAELHTQTEVDILEMIMELDNNDIELFHRYINHSYPKGIRELQQIVRSKTD